MRKDFVNFGRPTPAGTPVSGEKEGEKKGSGLSTITAKEDKEGERKTGFPGFGFKKDGEKSETEEKSSVEGSIGLQGKRILCFNVRELIVATEKPADAKSDIVAGMKNKTMEEIINKWTGELDRCGEQFKAQANDIRRWDAILVENGDKVETLNVISNLDCKIICRNIGSHTSSRSHRHGINVY